MMMSNGYSCLKLTNNKILLFFFEEFFSRKFKNYTINLNLENCLDILKKKYLIRILEFISENLNKFFIKLNIKKISLNFFFFLILST
jgi:hypothetical protein